MQPMPPYFLVKIPRKEQKNRKGVYEKIIIPETLTFMERNLQWGYIVSMGKKAREHFPQAQAGDIALLHHFVESNSEQEAKETHLVHQDEQFNYYVVTAFEHNGKGNECYGIYNGEKIIPNKDYVFLEAPIATEAKSVDDYINDALQQSDSGLFLFKEWKETREDKEAKMAKIKEEIGFLSKSDTRKHHIQVGILQKEEEMEKISREINNRSYQPFRIAAFNTELQDHFKTKKIVVGETVWMLNHACLTEIEFMGKKYRVAKTNYIGFVIS